MVGVYLGFRVSGLGLGVCVRVNMEEREGAVKTGRWPGGGIWGGVGEETCWVMVQGLGFGKETCWGLGFSRV